MTSPYAGAEILMKNQPSNVYATLMNYSEQGSPECRIHFFVDGQLKSQQSCPLATGQRKILITPYAQSLPSRIVALAWNHQLNLGEFNESQMLSWYKRFLNQGPEPAR